MDSSMKIDASFYNADYYERGIETQVSCYQNYRWIPELTIPMAMAVIDLLGIKRSHTILDFGCAFGYLVKAFRLLHREAWGVDISEYALNHVDSEVKAYCCSWESTLFTTFRQVVFDFCIAKDVFEHIPENELRKTLEGLKIKTLFAVIPLGENGNFYAEANNFDKSHIICEPAHWWVKFISDAGWKCDSFSYLIDGIKDNYKNVSKAHGFFIFRNEKC